MNDITITAVTANVTTKAGRAALENVRRLLTEQGSAIDANTIWASAENAREFLAVGNRNGTYSAQIAGYNDVVQACEITLDLR